MAKYIVSGQGGADIGAFTASLPLPGALQWTNKLGITVVDRSSPLTITWSGGTIPDYVLFGGAASSNENRMAFACIEEARRGTLTVPEFILKAMSAAPADRGYLFLAQHPLDTRFTAPGLDLGYFLNLTNDFKAVEFR